MVRSKLINPFDHWTQATAHYHQAHNKRLQLQSYVAGLLVSKLIVAEFKCFILLAKMDGTEQAFNT